MNGWKAHIDDRSSPLRRSLRLLVYRDLAGTGTEVVLADGTRHVYAEGDVDDGAPVGWLIPAEALEALREAIDERIGRRYDEALVFEVRATLERERTRVDDLVEKVVDAALDAPRQVLDALGPARPLPLLPVDDGREADLERIIDRARQDLGEALGVRPGQYVPSLEHAVARAVEVLVETRQAADRRAAAATEEEPF